MLEKVNASAELDALAVQVDEGEWARPTAPVLATPAVIGTAVGAAGAVVGALVGGFIVADNVLGGS
ncbi:hypothetical protein DB35_17100 [Streptomyces abyssalis]|uniref:Uncharacterized protein n=1 Tax=Streptomyces abyssalis TaxID=933944 RepID=A0A1E7JKH9_9ACTN|nr:hypothetical protein AN215_18275 [Streptomyces abyssalis]OEU90996.1 hypothetical protein DB35_17100 [Streptomyces abyssalis]